MGCETTSVPAPEHGPDGRNLWIERAIRNYLAWLGHPKLTGELTKADYEKVVSLNFFTSQLTDLKGLEKCTQLRQLNLMWNRLTNVKGLEKLTKLEVLELQYNPALTKAQIDALKKALPKCKIYSNPTK